MKIYTEPTLAIYLSLNHTWNGCPHIEDSFCTWFTDGKVLTSLLDVDKITQPLCAARDPEQVDVLTWNCLTDSQQYGKDNINIRYRMSEYDFEDPWDTSNPNEMCTCSCTYNQPIRLIFSERLSPDQVKENLINAYFEHLFDTILAEDEIIDHGIMTRLKTIAKEYWHWSDTKFVSWLVKISNEIILHKQKIDEE